MKKKSEEEGEFDVGDELDVDELELPDELDEFD